MQDDIERWKQLAKLAANEQDPDKLLLLVKEINELLDAKQKRLDEARRNPKPDD